MPPNSANFTTWLFTYSRYGSIDFHDKCLFLSLCFLQPIVYEGQDKNPEMCRVLLTHEIMCRWGPAPQIRFLPPQLPPLQMISPSSPVPCIVEILFLTCAHSQKLKGTASHMHSSKTFSSQLRRFSYEMKFLFKWVGFLFLEVF